jgi:nitrogenase molybdenum-iron protein alpha/beta subunit
MIVKKKLTLFEESYNEGYSQALEDVLNKLSEKYPKNKIKYRETIEEILNSFEEDANE